MITWHDAASRAAARYGAIGAGLLIGTAAKYGLALREGNPLTWRGVVADILLLGMVGLIGLWFADWMHLDGDARVVVGSLAAVSSDRLIRLARSRFLEGAATSLEALAQAARAGDVAEVPAGSGDPETLRVRGPTPDDPTARAGNALRAAFRGPTRERLPLDHIELLRRLDDHKP